MSGFEIAGIALGAFPIVLAMLESQGKGWEKVDALLHHREEVRRFHVALNTEWVIFRDTCEQLLQNQMGEAAIERLFSPPASYATIDNGRQWNAVRNALKGRMRSRTVEAFIDNVHEMNRFLKELYSIYPQDTDYLARLSSRAYAKKVLKTIKFHTLTYKHQEIHRNVQRINGNIQALLKNGSFAHTSTGNARQAGKSIQIYCKTRTYAKGLYDVLTENLGQRCPCMSPHTTGLRLDIRDHDTSTDKPRIPSVRFRTFLAMNISRYPTWQSLDIGPPDDTSDESDHEDFWDYETYANSSTTTISDTLHVPSSTARPNSALKSSKPKFAWKKVSFGGSTNKKAPPCPPPNIQFVGSSSRPESRQTRLSRESNATSSRSSISRSSISRSPSPQMQPIPIVDSILCQYLLRYITGNVPLPPYAHLKSIKYPSTCLKVSPILPRTSNPIPEYSHHRTVTLKSLFNRRRFNLSLKACIQLAARLASSVLQLHASGWLDEEWDSTDISFLEGPDGNVFLDSPLATGRNQRDMSSGPPPMLPVWCGTNRTLLSLGIVLIELYHRRCFEDFEDEVYGSDADPSSIEYQRMHYLPPQDRRISLALKLADELKDNAVSEYEAAVRRCLRGLDYPEKSLDHSGYLEAAHVGIICPLKDALKAFDC